MINFNHRLFILAMSSLLVTSPYANADVRLETTEHDAMVTVDPDDIEESNIKIDAEGGMNLYLPLDLGLSTRYRFEETVDSMGDIDVDKAYMWKTVEELALQGKLLVNVKVGKIRDVGFGADNTGIGSTASIRKYDDALVQGQVALRGRTGVQVTALEQLLPHQLKAVKYLESALSGVTITFFDPASTAQPEFESFKNMEAFAIQKVGRALGVTYQASYMNADLDSVKDSRWSLSAHKCFERVCVGGEHINSNKSDVAATKTQTRALVGTVYKNTDVAMQYTHQELKPNAPANTRGKTLEAIARREVGPGVLGGSIGRDLDLKENVYSVNYNVKFGGKSKKPGNSDMFSELRAKQAMK
jgi:hypothetical protein